MVAVPESSRLANARMERASPPSSSTICKAASTIVSMGRGGRLACVARPS
ncbi:Uncharacterised protein [Mycobacteroides abscessus subsp. abscessus]|nr:Uncharacterised protein [Mycobacteroides abscessus subsp. abscessus]